MAEYIDTSTEITIWDICEDGAVHFVKTTVAQFLLGHLKCNDLINGIPIADVKPVVRGEWRLYSPFTDTYECDKCGYQVIDGSFRTNFCPWCGADMMEVNDD